MWTISRELPHIAGNHWPITTEADPQKMQSWAIAQHWSKKWGQTDGCVNKIWAPE